MREIKFRAWDKKKKGMIETHQFMCGHFTESCLYNCFTDKDFILMQFTGLKDKNGKEIYEGDIVEMGEMGRVWWRRGTVEMRQGCWCGRINHWQTPILSKTVNEVIGNIKENEELLNE